MTQSEKETLIRRLISVIDEIPVEEKPQTQDKAKDKKIELLTIKECTRLINGLSECTLRSLVKKGRIRYIRSGTGARGKILIPRAALLEYFGG